MMGRTAVRLMEISVRQPAECIQQKPLGYEHARRDDIFPIAASRDSFARVGKIYETLDAAGSFQYETFDGEHSFHGVKGLPFLAEHL
jgi:hypothetical protein